MTEPVEASQVEENLISQYSGEEIDWSDYSAEESEDVTEDEGTEEEVEETEAEPVEEEEETEGDVEEVEEDDIEDINWQEMLESLKGEKANLNKALHAEREKRKEASTKAEQLEAALASASNNSYKEQLAQVKAQLKELDLEDVIKIDEPAPLDPRLQTLLQQQEAAAEQQKQYQLITEMQSSVSEQLGGYGNIDAESTEQGQILGQLIMSGVKGGLSMNDAVSSSMETLNSLLGKTTKVAKTSRTPVVKPKAKPIKAATHTKARTTPAKKAIADGDFASLFARMGKEMSGE